MNAEMVLRKIPIFWLISLDCWMDSMTASQIYLSGQSFINFDMYLIPVDRNPDEMLLFSFIEICSQKSNGLDSGVVERFLFLPSIIALLDI